MRIQTVACFTLAAFALTETNQGAIAAQPDPSSVPPPTDATPDSQASDVAVTPVVSVAPPDLSPSRSVSVFDPLVTQLSKAPGATKPEAIAHADTTPIPAPTVQLTTVETGEIDAPIALDSESSWAIALPENQTTPPPRPITSPPVTVPVAQAPAPSAIQTAQTPPPTAEVEEIQDQLQDVADFGDIYEGSPAITITSPSGYGADNGRGYVGVGFQASVRDSDEADATLSARVGVGDATDAVGLELSYTLASFGTNRDFGSGGFNAKFHRRLGENVSIAAGWEGFLTTGDPVDFEDSLYGAITYVAETAPSLDDPFSRVAFTAGLGNGRFRTEEAIEDDEDTVGVFGSVAVRIARPVSAIVEWTGQDLALGVSITPIRDFPLVITPALRDVAGAGDGARFVLGAGVSFRF